jgi:prevent-host-death family protein
MQLDFSLLSMTELRTRPGELLDRVSDSGEAFIIERNGQRKACLVPLSVFFPDISPARIAEEMKDLEDHGEEPRPTITEQRELVFRFLEKLGGETPVEIKIVLPHGYPNKCPRVYASGVSEEAPHRWGDGALCIYGVMIGWNPGKSTVRTTLGCARQWLQRYDNWRTTGEWPGPKETSNE